MTSTRKTLRAARRAITVPTHNGSAAAYKAHITMTQKALKGARGAKRTELTARLARQTQAWRDAVQAAR